MRALSKSLVLLLVLAMQATPIHAAIVDTIRLDTNTTSVTPRQLHSVQQNYMSMSGDGRYIMFMADNYSPLNTEFDDGAKGDIVAHDMNMAYYPNNAGNDFGEMYSIGSADVFVYDRVEGTYELASRVSNGRNNHFSAVYEATMSGNGRFVAYDNIGGDPDSNYTYALVEDDDTGADIDHSGAFPKDTSASPYRHINIFDREENKSRRLTTYNGDPVNQSVYSNVTPSQSMMFSGDGRFLVYTTNATNITADIPANGLNVYLYDIVNNTYEFMNKSSSGVARSWSAESPAISQTGRFVAFRGWTAPEDSHPSLTLGQASYQLYDRDTDTLTPVDVNDLGEGSNSWGSNNPSVSADGRYVAFISQAQNLAPGTNNGRYQVFLRDMSIHGGPVGTSTKLISKDSLGIEGDDDSEQVTISADGSKVIFTSRSTNLVAGDTNNAKDVFIYDIASDTVSRVTVDEFGNEGTGNNWSSMYTSISDDGSVVSVLTDMLLSGQDTNAALFSNSYDVYVYDSNNSPVAEMATLVSNEQPSSRTINPSMSADGNLIAFESAANSLSPSALDKFTNIYLYNKTTGTTQLISTGLGGSATDGNSKHAKISADGSKIVFSSRASNLIPGDTNGSMDIFMYDVSSGAIERISKGLAGAETDADSSYPSLSADGNIVAYTSRASNIVAGDLNTVEDVFWYDITADTTVRVSVDSSGTEADFTGVTWYSQRSRWPVLTEDGQKVFFQSTAINLVPGDTNGVSDIFMHDIATSTTTRVSEEIGGGQLSKHSVQPSISADGNIVVYQEALQNGNRLLYKNMTTGTTQLLVPNTGHTAHTAYFQNPSISANGEYVTFESFADTLVAGDTNKGWDTFLHHIPTNTTTRLSQQSNGTEAERSDWNPFYNQAALSADGKTIAFTSSARNIVTGDTAQFADLFVTTLEKATVSFNAATSTFDEDDGTVTFDLLVEGGVLLTDRTVTITITGGTATAGSDYTFTTPATITIPAGDYTTSQTVPVTLTILTDATVEPDETILFTVSSSDADITLGGTTQTTITIRDVPPVVPPVIPPVVPGTGGSGGGGYISSWENPTPTVPAEQPEPSTRPSPVEFSDTRGHWGEDTIRNIVLECGLTGYQDETGESTGTFKPDQPITRAELMVMLTKCFKSSVESPETAPFPDVPTNHWSAPWVAKAKSLGLIHGYGDGLYRPDRFASVAEATKIILLGRFPMQGIMNSELSITQSTCAPMLESAWYIKYMNFALNKDFMSIPTTANKLIPNACSPDAMITRVETARIIERALALDIYNSHTPLTEVIKAAE